MPATKRLETTIEERQLAQRDWEVIRQVRREGLSRDRRYQGVLVRRLVARVFEELRAAAPEWSPASGGGTQAAEVVDVVGLELDQKLGLRFDLAEYEGRKLEQGRRDWALLDSGPEDAQLVHVKEHEWVTVGDLGWVGLMADRRRYRESRIMKALALLHEAQRGWEDSNWTWTEPERERGRKGLEAVRSHLAQELVFRGEPTPHLTWVRALGLADGGGE